MRKARLPAESHANREILIFNFKFDPWLSIRVLQDITFVHAHPTTYRVVKLPSSLVVVVTGGTDGLACEVTLAEGYEERPEKTSDAANG